MKKQEQEENTNDESTYTVADYLPLDHIMNDPNCTCEACTYGASESEEA